MCIRDRVKVDWLREGNATREASLIENLRPAEPDEIRAALGAQPGSLGGVGAGDFFIIADESLRRRSGMVTGANEDDFHLRGVDVERDIPVKGWLDLREVKSGEG